jgi:glycine dehydrogenase
MLGKQYVKKSTSMAILNANYVMNRLDGFYKIAYTGENGYCAHEFILDTLR